MRILVDENVPRMTANRLREMGHDVKDVRGTSDEGLVDSGLWDLAVRESPLLVTTDKGFTAYRALRHAGILVVRLRQPNRAKIDRAVIFALRQIGESEWPGLLVVMRDTTMSTSRQGSEASRQDRP